MRGLQRNVTRFAGCAVTLLPLVAGCASAPAPPEPAAPPAPPPTAPLPAPPPSVEPSAPPPAEPEEQQPPAEPSGDPLNVLVMPSADQPPVLPPDLVAAAAAERVRREQTGPPSVVIDDRSLADYADVEITESERSASPPGPAVGGPGDEVENELYWRQQVLDARLRWREAHDSIARLEGEIAGLRRQFYAEDDPHYRDSQIKPAWDRALEGIRLARLDVEAARRDLAVVLHQGRRAGARPGWLREGIDLEPEGAEPFDEDGVDDVEDAGIYEPEDPQTVGPSRGGGGDGR